MEIAPWDPVSAPEHERRAWFEVDSAVDIEHRGDVDVSPYAESIGWLTDCESRVMHHWVAWADATRARALGVARLMWWTTSDDQTVADFDVRIPRDLRRGGLGSRLLEPVLERAAIEGRRILGGETVVGHEAGTAFLEVLGMTRRFVGHRNLLLTKDVDRDLLRSWVARAPERAAGYSLLAFRDRVPEEWMDEYIRIKEVINTAPKEDLEMGDDRYDPQLVRAMEDSCLARESSRWTLVAVHDDTRAFAGITELVIPERWPEHAYQEDTAVDPAHRDRGLGRWLKGQLMLDLLEELPAIAHVETWNAGSNDAMLGINTAMGFRPAQEWGTWQGPTALAIERNAERLASRVA